MISIITVVRNNVARIDATIRSVLSQKDQNIEYIVIDGASTDGTLERIRSYGRAIDVLVSENDGGIYEALNKGIARASGSLVGIVHSGDSLLPGVLGRILVEHAATPGVIIYGCTKTVSDGHFESIWGWNHDSLPERMLPHPACFVPKSVYDACGAYDESYRVAGDYEAFLRYYSLKVPFRFIDVIVQEFDLKGISQTRSFEDELRRIRQKYHILMRESPETKLRRACKDLLRRAFKGMRILVSR